MEEVTVEVLPPGFDVSRETNERLRAFLRLVERWNQRINLVSKSTISQAWTRHIIDSAQLWFRADRGAGAWLDLGSGGGFPGLVIAILAHDLEPGLKVTMVEADQRKCVFLREAARQLGVSTIIRNERIEALAPAGSDVVSARALSSLSDLLGHAHRHLGKNGVALFLKGKNVLREIEASRRDWTFDLEHWQSLSDADGVVLKIRGVAHV